MNDSVIARLRCPVCHAACRQTDDGKSFFCEGTRKHCFDFAKSGYLNLAGPQGGAGDLKDAVRARTRFLESGYYERLSDAVNRILDSVGAESVLDAGCGEGYYTNRLPEKKTALGADLSRDGVDHAAKSARARGGNAAFLVASLFTLPVADASFDAVISLFAPCAEEEFLRILKPEGHLLLVGAGENHLFGLKQILYDDPYRNPGRADLPTGMTLLSHERLTYPITVTGREVIDALFSMTPYYWRTSEKDRAKLDAVESLTTDVDFDLYLYQKGTNR